MSIEFNFTAYHTIRIQCGTETIEVPLPAAHQIATALGTSAAPAQADAVPTTPQKPEEPRTLIPTTPPKPIVHGRPKPDPGVMAIITDDDERAPIPPEAWSTVPDLDDRNLTEVMVSLVDLENLPQSDLKEAIAQYRTRIRLDGPQRIMLDVKVGTYPGRLKFHVAKLQSIVSDPSFGVSGIRLIQLPVDE